MDLKFLDFEQPIAELEAKIEELRFVGDDSKLNISEEIDRLKPKSEPVTRNIFSSLSQGYAVSGSFSRSAVNFSAGARTGFSAVVTGVVVGITLLWLTPLLYHLPQATLAAVIIMAVINLVKIEPIKHAWKVQRHDAAVSIITFVLTIIWAPRCNVGKSNRIGQCINSQWRQPLTHPPWGKRVRSGSFGLGGDKSCAPSDRIGS